MKSYLLLIISFFLSLNLSATHLIGGELTYAYLGNNQYEFLLTIYIDCGPTNTTGTSFDPSITLSVYNAETYESYTSAILSNPVITELGNETAGNDCLELPADLCIVRGQYSGIISLPPSEEGYIIAYQRCCRNPSIINIETPDVFGSTFTTQIPSTNVAVNNSSAAFTEYPPLALCLGDDLNVNLSAIDVDGDSLAYEFTTPFHGANDLNPTEITPPPFSTIPWATSYAEDNPMDANPVISIDNQSGYISGTPSQLGMYIIGVKVNEFRNGLLINSIIRDFRFLVVDCNVTTASIPLSNWYCNGFTVYFGNDSYNSNSYIWDFGVNNATSTEFEPTYTYPDTGNYTVSLIANPNSVCADTNIISFPLYTELSPFFQSPDPQCITDNNFEFTGDGISPPGTDIYWDFGPLATPPSSTLPDPINVSFALPGSYPVTYNLQYNDCNESYTSVIEIYDVEIDALIETTAPQCLDDNSFNFNVFGDYPTDATFIWDFGQDAIPSSAIEENPTDISFTTYGNHPIDLLISANGCIVTINSMATIHAEEQVEILSTNPIGCDSLNVSFSSIFSESDYNYYWDLGNGLTSTDSNPNLIYTEGAYDISLTVLNTTTMCESNQTLNQFINVYEEPVAAFSLTDSIVDFGEEIYILNEAQNANNYQYVFSTGSNSLEEEPSFVSTTIGYQSVWQYISSDYGCIDSTIRFFTVEYPINIWVPNVFTPDGDLLNDYFKPITKNIEYYELSIFNRFGEMIFSEGGNNPKWSGKKQDDSYFENDSYNYVIKYATPSKTENLLMGYVILLR